MSACKLLYCDGTADSHMIQWNKLLDEHIESATAEYQKNAAPEYSADRVHENLTVDDLFVECKESFSDMACSPYESKTDSVSKWLDYMYTFSDEIIGDLYLATYMLKPKNRKILTIIADEMPTFKCTEKKGVIYIKYIDLIKYTPDNHTYEKTRKSNRDKLQERESRNTSRKQEHDPAIVENKLHLYKVLSMTDVYRDAVQYASSGTFDTEETVTFKYLRDIYTVVFDFSFSYDDSNGITTSGKIKPKLLTKDRSLVNVKKLDDQYLVHLISYLISKFVRNAT